MKCMNRTDWIQDRKVFISGITTQIWSWTRSLFSCSMIAILEPRLAIRFTRRCEALMVSNYYIGTTLEPQLQS